MTPQERADRSAAAMWAQDCASQALGMQIAHVGPGTATLTMTVRPDMLNGHGICHGGYVYMLADSAFAFACNTYNQRAVAQSNHVTYLEPVADAERLTARAQETARQGRSGTYDVVVTGDDGRTVALFRGLCRVISGTHFEEE